MREPVPHPWNDSFTWQSPQPPFRRVTESEAAQFDREGYVVLEDLVEVEAITAELDPHEAKIEAFFARRQTSG